MLAARETLTMQLTRKHAKLDQAVNPSSVRCMLDIRKEAEELVSKLHSFTRRL